MCIVYIFNCRQSWSTTPSSCLYGTRSSVSPPPTETNSRKTTTSTMTPSPETFCVSTATSLIPHRRWQRHQHQAFACHFTTLFNTCWTHRQSGNCPLIITGGRCTGSATPASYSKNILNATKILSSPLLMEIDRKADTGWFYVSGMISLAIRRLYRRMLNSYWTP